ncbi:MAG: hypothetical protein IJL78_03845 [Lachnospiraceae bacterium]|nr:hypothetical protein [Lachnospiraceae bacterium]
MVKKLFKYEFSAMLKKLLPLFVIVLGTAFLNRIIQFFERDSTTYNILFVSSVVLLVISCVVLLVGTLWISVSRYYKNMFTNEGYLTLSLPVTADQHITTKCVTALACGILSFLVCLFGGMIATSNGIFSEIVKAGWWLLRKFTKTFGAGRTISYSLEVILLLLLSAVKTILVLYACVSLGQLGKRNRNRPAKAVGFFFIYYFAVQVLATAGLIVIAVLDLSGKLEALAEWINLHPHTAANLFLWIGIVWSAGFCILYYWISRHVLTKKLNLE